MGELTAMTLHKDSNVGNIQTIHKVHSVHYYQMMSADLLENVDREPGICKPPVRSLSKIKGTGIYLQVNDSVTLEPFYECCCDGEADHKTNCPAKQA